MLYGTTVRTPIKRRFLGTPTPNKTRKVPDSLLTDVLCQDLARNNLKLVQDSHTKVMTVLWSSLSEGT